MFDESLCNTDLQFQEEETVFARMSVLPRSRSRQDRHFVRRSISGHRNVYVQCGHIGSSFD